MPRHCEEIVGIHSMRLRLRDYWYPGAGRKCAELLLIYFRDEWNLLRCDGAVLKHDVALGRRAIAQDQATISLERFEQVSQMVTMLANATGESSVGLGRV